MSPDDPRHGTQAGHSQHIRDGETPCPACKEGDNKAGRRRRKRRQQGHIYTRPIGARLHTRLTNLRDQGATYQALADRAGVSFAQMYNAINRGPEYNVRASTWLRLNSIDATQPITLVGITRRIQALNRLGYSVPRICNEIDLTLNAIKPIREGTAQGPLNHRTRQAIVALYARWHMTLPDTDTINQRRSVTRTQNYAQAMGWAPPLAWENIDDPEEQPADWEYRPGRRIDQIVEMDAAQAGVSEVCRRLHMSRDTLQKMCARHDMSDLYRRLVTRETYSPNGTIGAA